MTPNIFSITDAVAKIGCRPRDISDAFFQQHLDESRVFRLGGRRVIPREYLPEIRRVLTERGKVRQPEPV